MVWTAPKTWNQGELVTEDSLNEQLRDNLVVLKVAVNDSGKLYALSAAYVADLSGANLTGVLKTAAGNSFTAGKQDFNGGATTRLVLPVGTDKWAT